VRAHLARLWRAWVELLDRRERPTSLVLARVLVAAAILGDLLQAWLHDVIGAVWAPPPHGTGYASVWDPLPPFMVRWFGPGVDTAELVFWIAVAASALLMIGAATRVSAIVLALMLAQLGHMAPEGDRGIDFLLRTAVAILAFSSCHARWSVDSWVRRRIFKRPFAELVPAWPRYLLFAQVVWMYFSAGHNKGDKAWGPFGGFSALANILSDPHFARFDGSWIPYAMPLLALGTATTVLFELSSPLLPILTWWHRTPERPGRLRKIANRLRLRWAWIATGVIFHIGIAVTMRLGVFPWGMLALYPVLFHPDEIHRAAGWLRARLGRTAAAALLLLVAACGGSAGETQPPPQPQASPAARHGGEHASAHGDHTFDKAEDWAALFDHPSRAAWQKPDEVVALLALTPGMTVVDVGAGTGYFLSRLSAAVGASGRVVATDIQRDMVRYMNERAAREKLGNVSAVLAPPDDVGVAAGSADRALVVDVWHHIQGREQYAARLARVLRPGGAVVIVDFTLESRRGPPRDHRLAPDTIMAELRAAGFAVELASESLPDQYVVIGRLPAKSR
jgi:SAM-dependent methyltransferase